MNVDIFVHQADDFRAEGLLTGGDARIKLYNGDASVNIYAFSNTSGHILEEISVALATVRQLLIEEAVE